MFSSKSYKNHMDDIVHAFNVHHVIEFNHTQNCLMVIKFIKRLRTLIV